MDAEQRPAANLIDEVQAHQEELRQLIVAYQEMVGEGMDVLLVLAGLPTAISSVLNDHVLTFLNRAVKINLPPLRIGDVEFYYRRAFADLNIQLQEKQISDAAQETEGSPSRRRCVRRISFGMTTRPRSSMRRTIPVAFN